MFIYLLKWSKLGKEKIVYILGRISPLAVVHGGRTIFSQAVVHTLTFSRAVDHCSDGVMASRHRDFDMDSPPDPPEG